MRYNRNPLPRPSGQGREGRMSIGDSAHIDGAMREAYVFIREITVK
jgi:hypothetical protein